MSEHVADAFVGILVCHQATVLAAAPGRWSVLLAAIALWLPCYLRVIPEDWKSDRS